MQVWRPAGPHVHAPHAAHMMLILWSSAPRPHRSGDTSWISASSVGPREPEPCVGQDMCACRVQHT